MNINVHIERLILNDIGIKPHQETDVKVAVESELHRNLATHGLGTTMQSTSNRQVAKGGLVSLENNRKPAGLGQQIGKAVYKCLRE